MIHLNGININPVALTISHAGKTVSFRKKNGNSMLFDVACRLIIGPPATFIELCDCLYGEAEDGGPEWAKKATEVHIQHLKPKLEFLKLKIYKAHVYRDRGWRETWIAP